MPGTRKLGRPTDHRRSMLRGLVTYLLENGRIETTATRAKEVRCMAEKMITIAKVNSLYSKRKVLAYVTKEDVVKKLFDEIAPKYNGVNGGYTRIVRTGPRRGDAAEMCIIELVESEADKAKAAKAAKAKAAKSTKKVADTKKASDAKPAKTTKTEKAETAEKPVKAKKAETAEKPAKATATVKAEKVEKPLKAEKVEKADETETEEKAE